MERKKWFHISVTSTTGTSPLITEQLRMIRKYGKSYLNPYTIKYSNLKNKKILSPIFIYVANFNDSRFENKGHSCPIHYCMITLRDMWLCWASFIILRLIDITALTIKCLSKFFTPLWMKVSVSYRCFKENHRPSVNVYIFFF